MEPMFVMMILVEVGATEDSEALLTDTKTVGVLETSKKPDGKFSVINLLLPRAPPADGVKVNVAETATFAATRSAPDIINVTASTTPPITPE